MSVVSLIGNTPTIKLNLPQYGNPNIFLKLEYYNPGGSIKTRVAYSMIKCAQEKGTLKRGNRLIEATGGNTGLGLAVVSNVFGYELTCVIPDNYSKEKIKMLNAFGAKTVLSDSSTGGMSHVIKCKEMIKDDPTLVYLDQLNNIANINAHYYGTGREIYRDIEKIQYFVTGVGSGGTFCGTSLYLKERNKNIKCYIMQPEECDIMEGTAVKHKIQGVSLGIKPPLLDYALIDGTISISYRDVRRILLYVMKTNGLFLGISSGANILAAIKLANEFGKNKNIVTLAPDEGRSYLDDYLDQ